MGDILHALPAVASLKSSFPHGTIRWAIESKWLPLVAGNPDVDEVIPIDRSSWSSLGASLRGLRSRHYDVAVDFQGLYKSSVVAWLSRAKRRLGFARDQLRERGAALFYTAEVPATAAHVVERNLELAAAAGAHTLTYSFAIPEGAPEGELPIGSFVLASPFAGWASKQWPLEHYVRLGGLLQQRYGLPLVLNVSPDTRSRVEGLPSVTPSVTGLPGLIFATRRAVAVVGVDSGPLHLAAALAKPGVAIFGPTDPGRNGPYGGTLRVLRMEGVETTYARGTEIAASMRAIEPCAVADELGQIVCTGQKA